jgi:hypothetical protein
MDAGCNFAIKKSIDGKSRFNDLEIMRNSVTRREAVLASHTEDHFFAIAAYKLIEYRDWVLTFGLCASVDFSEIDQFSKQAIRDLRNMREHVVEYFQGAGRASDRWVVETPEYKADASSVVGTMIGGRLDWVKFAAAAERLLPILLEQPIPSPSSTNLSAATAAPLPVGETGSKRRCDELKALAPSRP